jgi:hypothetical protein
MFRLAKLSFAFAAVAVTAPLLMPAPPASAQTICDTGFSPVCATKRDGTRETFGNACEARRARARILHGGLCYGSICLGLDNPVCARDPRGRLRTYSNLCYAENANAQFVRKGACR